MKKLLLLLLIIPFLSFGQCLKGDCVNGYGVYQYEGGEKYKGYWSNNQRHGEGDMNWGDGYKLVDGYWNNDQYVDGKRYSASGDVADGKFKDERLIDGKYTYKSGEWEDGKFKNDTLVDGRAFIYLEGGLKCYMDIEDGKVIKRVCNNHNQYNRDDIIRGPESMTIDLVRTEDENKTDDAFFLNLIINNRKVRFLFDTGSSTFNMNLSQWEELRSDLKYEDLKILSKVDAVGSVQGAKYYKILDPIQIDKFFIKNVIVSVVQTKTPDDPDNDNLIGVGFFKKFSNVIWNMNDQSIDLYK